MVKILQTPIVNAITPFDPLDEYTINFMYNDNQSVKNRAVITDNSTGMIAYDNTQNIMLLQHKIPKNTLIAGKQYTIQIQVFDSDGNKSNLSDPILFYCFSTPQFYFKNIQSGDLYKNASITLNIEYVQSENEPIRSFQFMKYSYDKTLLSSSETFYSKSSMSYSFSGLDNNTVYYFRAIGETSHGISLDTGYIEVNVAYEQSPMFILFDVKNNYCDGYISLSLNIKDIDYTLENDNYKLENGKLTLTDNSLTYHDGFSAENDFSLYVDAKKLKVGKFLTTNNDIFSLSVISVCGIYYCELSVANSDFKQYVTIPDAKLDNSMQSNSQIIDVSYGNDDTIVFEVKRVNGYYSLKSYNKSV